MQSQPEAAPPERPLLVELKRWPDACRPDRACEIGGVLYPAPDLLDPEVLPMWIDYLDLRVNTARNMFSNLVAALFGTLFGGIGAWAGTVATGNSWGALGGLLLVNLAVLLVGRRVLGDSDHRALEQRWLLYRERARELDLK